MGFYSSRNRIRIMSRGKIKEQRFKLTALVKSEVHYMCIFFPVKWDEFFLKFIKWRLCIYRNYMLPVIKSELFGNILHSNKPHKTIL